MELKNYRVLFLESLPFQLENYGNFPIEIITGVYLDFAPSANELIHEDDRELYKAINSLKSITGLPTSNLCLKTKKISNNSSWNIIKLLRLIEPFEISIGGSLEYKNKKELNNKSEKYNITTSINCNNKNFICINKKNNTNHRCNDGFQNCFYTEKVFNTIKLLNEKMTNAAKKLQQTTRGLRIGETIKLIRKQLRMS